MSDLRSWCDQAGLGVVRTYVQSGNLVLRSDLDERALVDLLEAMLRELCGFGVPVVVRTAAELADVVARCPFDTSVDPTTLVVGFASVAIATADLGGIEPDGLGEETFHIDGRELYLWLPNGQGRSPLSQALIKVPAGKNTTARNWRTVTTLNDWARDLDHD